MTHEQLNAAAVLWLAAAIAYLSLWMSGRQDDGREEAEDPLSAGTLFAGRGEGSPQPATAAGAARRDWVDIHQED
jgi:hypothetical protein